MHRVDVVSDGRHGKAWPVKRFWRVARRRRVAVAEKLRRDEKQLPGIERAVRPDQPLVAVMGRHVMRRQQHGIVARGVELSVRAVDDPRLRQRHAALGLEVVDDELVMLGGVRRRLGSLRRRARRRQKGGDQVSEGAWRRQIQHVAAARDDDQGCVLNPPAQDLGLLSLGSEVAIPHEHERRRLNTFESFGGRARGFHQFPRDGPQLVVLGHHRPYQRPRSVRHLKERRGEHDFGGCGVVALLQRCHQRREECRTFLRRIAADRGCGDHDAGDSLG